MLQAGTVEHLEVALDIRLELLYQRQLAWLFAGQSEPTWFSAAIRTTLLFEFLFDSEAIPGCPSYACSILKT